MKVGIYARVSTKDKQQNPEVQLEALRKYCKAMDWEIYQEYVDKAPSADFVNRKAWALFLKDASFHRFDVLLIWKLDRAFRSIVDASSTLQDLNRFRVGFRSLMDSSIDTTTPNGMLVFNILASVAQFEKDLIIMRINEGMGYAKEHGTKSGKPIGRQGYDIPFAEVCKAFGDGEGNLRQSAKLLSSRFNKKISAGFVLSRIKRAGLTKEEVLTALQTPPEKMGEFSNVDGESFQDVAKDLVRNVGD